MRKILSVTLAIYLFFTLSFSAYAIDAQQLSQKEIINILIQNGIPEENATVLPYKDQMDIAKKLLSAPEKVAVATTCMETDILSEIELFLSLSNDDLVNRGVDAETILQKRQEFQHYSRISVEELSDLLKIDAFEATMLKKAIAEGIQNKKNTRSEENNVYASGTIGASQMTYTQVVTNESSSTAPSYRVRFMYTWEEVYGQEFYEDVIVVAWGGGLNTKEISSSANYYHWTSLLADFGSFFDNQNMTTEEDIQKGIKFSFPQTMMVDYSIGKTAKTKKGFAQCVLYQTRFQGYDTKVISYYCHKKLIGNHSISISASGPSVSVSIGTGYDRTTQRSSNIQY